MIQPSHGRQREMDAAVGAVGAPLITAEREGLPGRVMQAEVAVVGHPVVNVLGVARPVRFRSTCWAWMVQLPVGVWSPPTRAPVVTAVAPAKVVPAHIQACCWLTLTRTSCAAVLAAQGSGATVFVAERAEGSAAGVLGACGCVVAATGEAESWPGATVVTDLPPNTIVTAIVTTIVTTIRIGRV